MAWSTVWRWVAGLLVMLSIAAATGIADTGGAFKNACSRIGAVMLDRLASA